MTSFDGFALQRLCKICLNAFDLFMNAYMYLHKKITVWIFFTHEQKM